MRILVVDDHAATRDLLRRTMEGAGHTVVTAGLAREAESACADGHFDALLVDVMLPDGSGIELCRTLRAGGLAAPILILTARGDVRDRVAGLDAGADDYLAKPFAVAELLARLRALGRRGAAGPLPRLQIGRVTLDLPGRRALLDGAPVAMTERELAILHVLARHLDVVVPRAEIVERVWGESGASALASLEVLIARIRRKLGGAEAPIRTQRGVGYALVTRP